MPELTMPSPIPSPQPFAAGQAQMVAEFGGDSVSCLANMQKQNGPLTIFEKGSQRTLIGFGPEANRAVFSKPEIFHIVGPPGPRQSAHRGFQLGLLGLNGPQHTQHRRLLMPAANKSTVVGQMGEMSSIVNAHMDKWKLHQQIDLYREMKSLSMTIAARLLFGIEAVPRADRVAASFQSWLDAYIETLLSTILPIPASPHRYQEMLTSAEELEVHFEEIIAARRKRMDAADRDLLAILIHAETAGKISHREVIGELHTLLNASYQTTASALTWTILMLATHPDAARELYRELDQDCTSDALTFTECVIKESLRILPPVVFTARRTNGPAELCGQPLRPGSYVIVSMYATHHTPELFPQPECFRPDRWRDINPSPYAYLPFGAGPRMCMGTAFSMQLFRIAVPAIFRRFQFAIEPGTCVNRHSNLTLGVDGSLPVTLVRPGSHFESVELRGQIGEMVNIPRGVRRRRAA